MCLYIACMNLSCRCHCRCRHVAPLVYAVVVIAVAALSGCGGGGGKTALWPSPPPTPAPPISPTPTPVPTASPTPTSVVVAITPATAVLDVSRSLSFAAQVFGTPDSAALWSVTEANGGTVTDTGVYTAPAAAGTYHVLVASRADATKIAVATVRVRAATGTVSVN